jgi:hypothetical protein
MAPPLLYWAAVLAAAGAARPGPRLRRSGIHYGAAAAGWHLCLVVAAHLFNERPIDPTRGMDARNYGWGELYDAYAERLGIGTAWPDGLRQRQ